MEEVWKDIPHYEGLYQVSSLGRVKSLTTRKLCSNQHGENWVYEGIIVQKDNGNGYQLVKLNGIRGTNTRTKNEYVHRLVALAFIPNPEHKPQVDHIDTNRANNEVTNLRWVTQSENNFNPITNKKLHCKKTGNFATGSRNGRNTHPESWL